MACQFGVRACRSLHSYLQPVANKTFTCMRIALWMISDVNLKNCALLKKKNVLNETLCCNSICAICISLVYQSLHKRVNYGVLHQQFSSRVLLLSAIYLINALIQWLANLESALADHCTVIYSDVMRYWWLPVVMWTSTSYFLYSFF